MWSGGRRFTGLAVITAALVFGFAIVLWALSAGLSSERIATTGKAFDDRMAMYRLVAGSVLDNPWVGVGHGAFSDAFPVYRTSEAGIGGFWNAAHNIYLEAMLGLGLPAFLVLSIAVGWCVWRVFLGAFKRQRNSTAPLAAAAASLFVLLHGLVDFSLQTPALAYVWSALLGFGVAQSWSSRETLDWSNSEEW